METSTTPNSDEASYSIRNLVIGTTLSVCTFVTQLLMSVVFFKNKRLRKTNNYYMLSLACADLLISVVSVPSWTTYTKSGYWPFGHLSCSIWHGLDHALCVISVHTIVFISIERFRSIRFPLKFKTLMLYSWA